jgi:hypothetical protein
MEDAFGPTEQLPDESGAYAGTPRCSLDIEVPQAPDTTPIRIRIAVETTDSYQTGCLKRTEEHLARLSEPVLARIPFCYELIHEAETVRTGLDP